MSNVVDKVRGRHLRPGPAPEQLAAVKAWVHRTTGVRIEPGGLDPAEQNQLVTLARKAESEGGGIDRAALTSRERKTFDGLLEGAAGLEPGTFAKQRKDAEALAQIEQLAVEARARPLSRKQEQSLLVELHQQMAAGCLRLEHVGTLVAILAQMQRAAPFAPGSRIERDGDHVVLVFNETYGMLGQADANGRGGNRKRVLRQLEANAWITVERIGGPEVAIRLGRRALRVLGIAPTKSKVAA